MMLAGHIGYESDEQQAAERTMSGKKQAVEKMPERCEGEVRDFV